MADIIPIVEGQGEQQAVPALLHRLNGHLEAAPFIRVNDPIRVKSGSFLNDNEYFKKYVSLAAAKAAQTNGVVLIIMDCEDYCPAILGQQLLENAIKVRDNVRYCVILAYREFESWFIAGLSTLKGQFGLSDDLTAPTNIDNIRDAKGWLNARMSVKYDPVSHQEPLTRLFDIEEARKCHSFDRLCRKFNYIVGK